MEITYNAVQHGCCATKNLVLPTESQTDFKYLEAAWFKTYEPLDEAEKNLIHDLVSLDWTLQRSIRTVIDIEAQIFAAEPNPLNWTEQHHKTLTRFLRYRTANQNAFAKCRKSIEDHRKNRAAETQKAEKHAIVKERFKVFERKNKPKPTWDETLASMRAEAIRLGYAPAPDPNAEPKP